MTADPFERVAKSLDRQLAWIAGGLMVLGGLVATAAWWAVDVILHRHEQRR